MPHKKVCRKQQVCMIRCSGEYNDYFVPQDNVAIYQCLQSIEQSDTLYTSAQDAFIGRMSTGRLVEATKCFAVLNFVTIQHFPEELPKLHNTLSVRTELLLR